MRVPIDQIAIERRVRKDMGDLTLLMASMRKHGQLNPVILTRDNELVAGHRRLESAKRLGWAAVEAVRLEQLSDIEKIELELDENLHRKGLLQEEIQDGLDRIERLKHPTALDRIGRFFRRLWARWFKRGSRR